MMPYLIVRSVNPGTNNVNGRPSNVGHAWVEINDSENSPGGSPESYGYYPEANWTSAPGEVRFSDRENYLGIGDSKRFYISEEQAQAVRDYANLANYGWYNLVPLTQLFDNNCATFAVNVLKTAGVNVDMPLDGFIPWLLPARTGLFCELNPEICDLFGRAKTATQRRDPLALDLDGDGLETVGITGTNTTLFDHDGDGVKTGTGWLKGDDAFLALDKNGNGQIDTGNELFGVDTILANGQKAASGFAALADLDSNRDGQFSSADTQYGNLRLWRDLNQDGISQADELQTLAAAGLASINLASTPTNIALGGGNIQSAAGTYTKTNGQTGSVGEFTTGSTGNLDLVNNPFYREFTDPLPLTPEAAALPDLHGAGVLRDLREAASLNPALIADVAGLAGTTRRQMLGQLDTLLQHWADSSTFKTSQQRAADMGMTLCFRIPGASDAELQAVQLIGAPGIDKQLILNMLQVSEARYDAVKTQVDRFGRLMGILEKFNGQKRETVNDFNWRIEA